MKKLMKKFEDIMVAVTFAEAGEYEEAKKIAGAAAVTEEKTATETVAETA